VSAAQALTAARSGGDRGRAAGASGCTADQIGARDMTGRWFGCGWLDGGVITPWAAGGMCRALIAEDVQAAEALRRAVAPKSARPVAMLRRNADAATAVRAVAHRWATRFGALPQTAMVRDRLGHLRALPGVNGYSTLTLIVNLARKPLAGCRPESAHNALRLFSAIWPADLAWPADVPRPDPLQEHMT
jgi:hypothetical protein